MAKPVYLVLENGTVFEGEAFGASGEAEGELVFTTIMTGYNELLTSPDYCGQIVLQTFPLSGACGIIPEDFESASGGPAAYIVKHPCDAPSNFRSTETLDSFMCKSGIVGMCNMDTRRLTKLIRENGEMKARITSVKPTGEELGFKPGAVQCAGVKEKTLFKAKAPRFSVALIDFGAAESLKRAFAQLGCDLWAFPRESETERITDVHPDGIVIAGTGEPDSVPITEAAIKTFMERGLPIFGFDIGHLLLARVNGFGVYKLKHGHRGANHPVKSVKSGRIYITGQNHGWAVESGSIDRKTAEESFVNVNDGTCEGIIYKNCSAYSVEFAPDSCAPAMFDEFIRSMEERKHASR